jgi:hypothetical protein
MVFVVLVMVWKAAKGNQVIQEKRVNKNSIWRDQIWYCNIHLGTPGQRGTSGEKGDRGDVGPQGYPGNVGQAGAPVSLEDFFYSILFSFSNRVVMVLMVYRVTKEQKYVWLQLH